MLKLKILFKNREVIKSANCYLNRKLFLNLWVLWNREYFYKFFQKNIYYLGIRIINFINIINKLNIKFKLNFKKMFLFGCHTTKSPLLFLYTLLHDFFNCFLLVII